jgi:hypothetical protein
MQALAVEERFEEAASARDRLRALTEALARARTDAWLLAADVELRADDGRRVSVRRGALALTDDEAPLGEPCPRERSDELSVLRAWIARHPGRLESADVPLAEPVAGGARLHRLLERLRTGTSRDRG